MKKFEQRYEAILTMQLTGLDKEHMLADLLADLYKDIQPTDSENEAAEFGECEKYFMYRKITNSFK